MGIYTHQNFRLNFTTPPPEVSKFAIAISPEPLLSVGFNMAVEISTASHFTNPPVKMPLSSIVVLAHIDTGATITSIDIGLARHLNLVSTGGSTSRTAAGTIKVANFACNISFPNTALMPFTNFPISSCNLGFGLEKNSIDLIASRNFGLLIGRDIMSRWNIVWNGPSSTVIVSD